MWLPPSTNNLGAARDQRPRPVLRGVNHRVDAQIPAYVVVWTINTSILDRRETLAGTEPSNRPAIVLSPTLPTTSRSAPTSSASPTSASTGAPTTDLSSMFAAPAAAARSLASRRIA